MKSRSKKFLYIVLLGFLFSSFTACDTEIQNNRNDTSSTVEETRSICEQIVIDIQKECNLSDMTEISQEQLFSLYGIQDKYIAYFSALKSSNSVSKDEVIVIQAMDEGSACSVRDCLENHYNNILNESNEYLPDEYEKIEKSAVVKDGIYVRLFISDDNEKMEEIYNSYEK